MSKFSPAAGYFMVSFRNWQLHFRNILHLYLSSRIKFNLTKLSLSSFTTTKPPKSSPVASSFMQYGIFGARTQILTNQKGGNTAFSLLTDRNLGSFPRNTVRYCLQLFRLGGTKTRGIREREVFNLLWTKTRLIKNIWYYTLNQTNFILFSPMHMTSMYQTSWYQTYACRTCRQQWKPFSRWPGIIYRYYPF